MLFRRGKVFCFEDRETKLQKSLATQDLGLARKIVQAKINAINQPMMNLVMVKTFLAAKDPKLITRTWSNRRCGWVVSIWPIMVRRAAGMISRSGS